MNWKYGFSLNGAFAIMDSALGLCLYSLSERLEYVNMVEICHDSVESYLDENPDVARKYGSEGCRYFDILKIANPEYDKKVTEWSLEHKRRKEEYYEKVRGWGKKYSRPEKKHENKAICSSS